MFTTFGKTWRESFCCRTKIRELKTRISKLNAYELKVSPTKIILNSANNMNGAQSEKYGLSPE